MKESVYIESTVISYLNGRPSRDLITAALQELTREWWDNKRNDFELFVSQSVIREISAGAEQDASKRINSIRGLEVLVIDEEAVELAEKIKSGANLPDKATEDALHIALATVNEIDYILTWNCKHIANAVIIPKIESVCSTEGYRCAKICTPQELMGVEE
jgi:predicted nucleic acid-binding protein